MEKRYKIGSYVFYVALGICTVKEYITMGDEEFVVLVSINSKNPLKIFVPLNNPEQINNICEPLSADQIEKVLTSDYKEIPWNTNKRERQEQFMSILHGKSFVDIISLILCLNKRNAELHEEKKRLSTFDGEILKKACRLCEETISHGLGITENAASEYFESKLAQ